ncbi:MAG TPA: galactose-1-phosphate uridylyltransferase [Actinomycetes bacterium]|nr:galactose-1-phosphate uridylyltransferase [Actinomycetes bacterium]
MSELRHDPFTRGWVIVAPERAARPHQLARPASPPASRHAAACPFCPGREQDTPPELWRATGPDGQWQVRVVGNRFPALAGTGRPQRRLLDHAFLAMDGLGHHEVVIESRHHDWDPATAQTAEVRRVLEAYRARYRALQDERPGVILPFRNHGSGAGTSLPHPHSQVVKTPVVPLRLRQLLDVARAYYDDRGGCLYVDVTEQELADGSRVVLATPELVALQPFASAAAHETWIMPRFHQASFGDAADQTLDALAGALRAVLAGLSELLGDPDYNYVVHSAPVGEERTEYFLWHVQLLPRLSVPAGFELGSGMAINPSLPETTAAALRDAIAKLGHG